MAHKPGISIRVGRRNFNDPVPAFEHLSSKANIIRRHLGELTRPFDEISSALIPRIKARFDTGELAEPPYRGTGIKRSRFTRAARRSSGTRPGGPTLKRTGRLQKAIERKSSPTRGLEGQRREVYKLVIGVNNNAPYYKEQLLGGTWRVPVRLGPRGGKYFDPDRLEGSTMSSEEFWGTRWVQISSYPESTHSLHIPATNFFHISTDMDRTIQDILMRWFQMVIKGGATPL